MTALLDVNVLVAVTQPGHEHHAAASGWLKRQQRESWATTPLTELGLLRLSCNNKVTVPALTPTEGVALVAALRRVTGHRFWPDTLQVGEEDLDWAAIRTHRQITDARLVALARGNSGRLATFDVALARAHGDVVLLLES